MISGSRLVAMAWSDNLFAFARTVDEAIELQNDLQEALARLQHLTIRPNSREVVKAASAKYPEETLQDNKRQVWQFKPETEFGVQFCLAPAVHLLMSIGFYKASSRLFGGMQRC